MFPALCLCRKGGRVCCVQFLWLGFLANAEAQVGSPSPGSPCLTDEMGQTPTNGLTTQSPPCPTMGKFLSGQPSSSRHQLKGLLPPRSALRSLLALE